MTRSRPRPPRRDRGRPSAALSADQPRRPRRLHVGSPEPWPGLAWPARPGPTRPGPTRQPRQPRQLTVSACLSVRSLARPPRGRSRDAGGGAGRCYMGRRLQSRRDTSAAPPRAPAPPESCPARKVVRPGRRGVGTSGGRASGGRAPRASKFAAPARSPRFPRRPATPSARPHPSEGQTAGREGLPPPAPNHRRERPRPRTAASTVRVQGQGSDVHRAGDPCDEVAQRRLQYGSLLRTPGDGTRPQETIPGAGRAGGGRASAVCSRDMGLGGTWLAQGTTRCVFWWNTDVYEEWTRHSYSV